MGREVRRVPKDWEHPKDNEENYIPLYDGTWYLLQLATWLQEDAMWDDGYSNTGKGNWVIKASMMDPEDTTGSYTGYGGPKPNIRDYSPIREKRDPHNLVMYETYTKGTPISPPFYTAEELATWMAAHSKAGTRDFSTYTYEWWLKNINDML